MLNFGLIGDGAITVYHKNAIAALGHKLIRVSDPKYGDSELSPQFFESLDWVVICSPSFLHYEHVKMSLNYNVGIICEKPLILPWQPLVDDDRINIVLQYRWAKLPDSIDTVFVRMVRGIDYFNTWKGDPKYTGGLFYNLFIHYIDLALLHHSSFIGCVSDFGENIRKVDDVDLFSFDNFDLYLNMYKDILSGKGVKPKDIFYLHWFLEKQSSIFGFGTSVLNKEIVINKILG